jgi:hypothetical protein
LVGEGSKSIRELGRISFAGHSARG